MFRWGAGLLGLAFVREGLEHFGASALVSYIPVLGGMLWAGLALALMPPAFHFYLFFGLPPRV